MRLGWWVCHQDPERTFSFGDAVMPLCARCTAIYLFLGLALASGLLAGRASSSRVLGYAALAAAAGCGVTLLQWLGAHAGFWSSNHLSRLLTGLPCGAGLGWLLSEALALRLARGPGHRGLAIALFAAVSATCLAILVANPPWPFAALALGALSLAGFYGSIAWGQAILLSFLIRGPDGKPRRPPVIAASAVLTVAEAVALSFIRI